MGIEFRKDRKRWGFRTFLHGKVFKKRFVWKSKADAKRAFDQANKEVERLRSIPPTALINAAAAYLEWLARKRSKVRFLHVRYNLKKWIIPFFGAETPVMRITSDQVEAFIAEHKQRVSLMTIWHYVKDFNGLMNWCIKNTLLDENPVRSADRSELRFRVRQKLPLDPEVVDKGAECLEGVTRAYYDFLRFTGARKDEGNRLEWRHLDLNRGLVLLPGKKTPESEAVRPLPTQLVRQLRELPRVSDFVFASARKRFLGKKIYDRRKMFIRVSKYLSQTYKRDIKLTPKDLRDYFGCEIVARTSDMRQVMDLMRHTNLETTTNYMRSRTDDLRVIVESLAVRSELPKHNQPSDDGSV